MRRFVVSGLAVGAIALAGGIHLSRASSFEPDPTFPLGPISQTTSHQIAKLTQVASKLAGRRATVNCWSKNDWNRLEAWMASHGEGNHSGWTWYATNDIELPPYLCETLAQTLARSANQPLYTAVAVTGLAHESAHASGLHSEGAAECRAIRTEPEAATLLGLPKALGKRLQHIYRGTYYLSDPPQYATPPCPAGLPGILVPDALGSAADLRPLQRVAAAVFGSLNRWKNLEGEDIVGYLSECSPVVSRTWERTRFAEGFSGPNSESVAFFSRRFKTRQEFATAVRRYPNLERCEIRLRNGDNREFHVPTRYARGQVPAALSEISPKVHAFRMVITNGAQKSNWDRFDIFDPADLGHFDIRFTVPVGTPIAQEVRAVKAALRHLPASG